MSWTHTAEINQVRTLEIDPASLTRETTKITAAPAVSGAPVALEFCIAPITASHQLSAQ